MSQTPSRLASEKRAMSLSTASLSSASCVASSWETLVHQPSCQPLPSRPYIRKRRLRRFLRDTTELHRATSPVSRCLARNETLHRIKSGEVHRVEYTLCDRSHLIVMLSAVAQPKLPR